MVADNGVELLNDLYALILAGGMGTRLWPRSRIRRPKQMLDIVSKQTMLQETVDRITPLIPLQRTFIVTNEVYAPLVREQIPDLPHPGVIIEPQGRGTAPCIGLAALHLQRLDPESVMASLNADHVIQDAVGFCLALEVAAVMARQGYLVTLGIEPDSPHTGYGYIQQGELVDRIHDLPVYRVGRFKEKPNRAQAETFLAGQDHYWNSGIFIWKSAVLLEAMRRHMPELYGQLQRIDQAIGTDQEKAVLKDAWQAVENASVDIGIMEKADNVVVIPIRVGWSDVGSWATLTDILPGDEHGNVHIGKESIAIDTQGTLLYGPHRLIATIGLRDMIVVDTEDVLLICPKDRAQDVRLVLDELKKRKKDEYL